MEKLLKRCVAWGALTAFWLGVISEAIATCVMTAVCSYPKLIAADAFMLAFLASMTATSVLAVKRYGKEGRAS